MSTLAVSQVSGAARAVARACGQVCKRVKEHQQRNVARTGSNVQQRSSGGNARKCKSEGQKYISKVCPTNRQPKPIHNEETAQLRAARRTLPRVGK